jgi:hypothetical protein
VIEPVSLRVVHQTTRNGMGNQAGENLLGVETPPRSEDAMDLSNRRAPIGYVMNDGEIEYSVVPAVLDRDGRRIAQPKAHSVAFPLDTNSRFSHHARIEVEPVHPDGSVSVEDDLDPDASSTTDFESVGARDDTTHRSGWDSV